MSVDLTLRCFLLAFEEKKFQRVDRPTRVVCVLPGDFPLDQAWMITKWSLRFRLNEKGNQSNSKEEKRNVAVLKNFLGYSVIS